MIKYMVKDYDNKEARYIVTAVHDSGLGIELGIGIKDSVSEILRVLNQAQAALEANTVNLFYRLTAPGGPMEKKSGIIIEGESKRQEAQEEVRNQPEPVQKDGQEATKSVSGMQKTNEDTQCGP